MIPLGQHIAITGLKNTVNPMEERTAFEETEVLAVSPDVRFRMKKGDRVVIRKSGVIKIKGTFIVPLSDCVLLLPVPALQK